MATKREMYEMIKARVVDNDEMVEFLNHQIELLNRPKGEKKPTATQVANEGIMADILAAMEPGVQYRCGDVVKLVGIESSQKASALLRKLVEAGSVVKTIGAKKVSYFELA